MSLLRRSTKEIERPIMSMTEAEANKLGDKIQKELGDDWKCYVWENLGWHVRWVNGSIALYHDLIRGRGQFSCMVGYPESGCGHADLRGVGTSSKNPKKAIQNACQEALKIFETEWRPIMDSVEKILKEL